MCVVPGWTDVLTTDTIQDERSGKFYSVEDIQQQPSLNIPRNIVLTLREVSGASWGSDGSPADE